MPRKPPRKPPPPEPPDRSPSESPEPPAPLKFTAAPAPATAPTAAPGTGLSAAELAAALGVSERMVGIYAGREMPSYIGPRGKRRFNLEECREWVRLNVPEPVRGGKAPHRAQAEGTDVPPSLADAPESDAKDRAIAAEVQSLLVAWLVERAVPEEISAAVLLAVNGGKTKSGGLTQTSIRTLKDGLDAERAADKLAQERKLLLLADNVRRAWTGALARLRIRLEELPARMTAAVVDAAPSGLCPEDQVAVRRALEASIRTLLEEISIAEGAVRAHPQLPVAGGGGDA